MNLGCGTDIRPDYINVDVRNDVGADLVHDVTKPFPLKDSSVNEVLAQDVFEHLTREQQIFLFSEVFRLLTAGGKLNIRIPNIDDIWQRFSDDPDTRNLFLYGDTSVSGIWGAHKSGQTPDSFSQLAVLGGFEIKKIEKSDTNYLFEFVKSKKLNLNGLLFINQTLGMGGAENFMAQLLARIDKEGVKTTAFTTSAAFESLLKSSNIKVSRIPVVVDLIGDWKGLVKGIFLFPAAVLYYFNLVFKYRNYGTILMSGYIEKFLVTPWARLFNVPVVWIEYGPLNPIFSKFFGLPKLIYRLVSRLPDYIIEPSENTRIKNLNISGFSAAKTKIIPCGIAPLKKVRAKPEKYSAYSVSRMEKGKGQDLLLKAWPRVVKKFPEAKLYLIGEGGFRAELEQLTKKLKIEKQVVFTGAVEDLSETIAPICLGVFPSVWELEGFGLVLLEAMSVGKPIVCFNSAPYSEIVDKDCAILVEKGNTDGIAEAIIWIFSDPELAKEMGERGRKKFEKRFDIGRIVPLYKAVLLSAEVLCRVRDEIKKLNE